MKAHTRWVPIILGGCVGLYLLTLISDRAGIRNEDIFNFLSPSLTSLWLFGASGAIPIFEQGRWWTVLSAAWLHGNLLHLAFNGVWIYQLGLAVEQVYGSGRFVLLYISSAVVGALLTATVRAFGPHLPRILQGAPISVGASGAVFGLLGALVVYGQRAKRPQIQRQAFSYAIVLFGLGLITPNVDNWGHLGGFVAGYGLAQQKRFNPLQPECSDPVGWAIAALLLTLLSILASIGLGLRALSAA